MKITKKRDSSIGSYYEFNGKLIKGTVWYDGSGELISKNKYFSRYGDYYSDSGTHKQRVQEIKSIANYYTSLLKELKQLDKKLKFSPAEKRGD